MTAEGGAESRGELQPREPELWRLTRAAVLAASAAVDQHLEAGGWQPRYRLGTVRKFDSGWPHLTSPAFTADDAPIEYSALIGSKRGQLTPIAYDDVAEIAALLEYVRGRQELRVRLVPQPDATHGERLDSLIDFEAAELPLSLLDRSKGTGRTGDEELLALYLARERAWLLDPLPCEYVVPLTLTALDLQKPLVIGGNIRLEPLDDRSQAARATSTSLILSGVPGTVVGAATHAIVLGNRQLANPGPGPRLLGGPDDPLDLSDADLVCEALRIVTHVDVGYAQVLRRPLGWADDWKFDLPPLTQVTTLRRYPDHFDNYGWLRRPNPIPRETLDLLPRVVQALRTGSPKVRLASRRLSLAALRDADDDRTVDACIGLEALLGDGRDELRHRISLRAATALATRPHEPANPEAIYTAMKKVYDHRSAVVHGAPGDRSPTIKLGEKTRPAGMVAIILLREILSDAHPAGRVDSAVAGCGPACGTRPYG